MKSRRAFISVYDHTGAKELAEGLAAVGFEIISHGKTAEYLAANGIKLTLAEELMGYATADIVAINFCPFKDIVTRRGIILDEAIGAIEAEGPAVARAAAKNWHDTVALIDPADYTTALEMTMKGGVNADTRYDYACKVFECTAAYDALIASYMRHQQDNSPMFPKSLTLTYDRVFTMRHGENPHQRAAFYREIKTVENGIDSAYKLSGKVMSFNNALDANLAIDILKEFSVVVPCAVIVRHANPCGVGVGEFVEDAYIEAYEADHEAARKGVVAVNREVDFNTAVKMSESGLEVIVAPSYSDEALEVLKRDKDLRLLSLNNINKPNNYGMIDLRKVAGGLLVQELDTELFHESDLKTVTKRAPNKREATQMLFAWRVAKHAKTDAVVLVKGNSTVGIGAGQQTRQQAMELALKAAGPNHTQGSVLASEAVFDKVECVNAAIDAGVQAIIQPGGAAIDAQAIALCDEAGVAMVFTGMRHFRH